MQKIIPQKLQKGDKIMMIAPSRGLKLIGQDCREIAVRRFQQWGLTVEFAKNTKDENFDQVGSWNIKDRASDVMQAFQDKSVKAVFTVIGGFNSNQLITHLDYDIIRENPKFLCGFSDVTALFNAIHTQTGLEVFYGPHFSSLGMEKGCEYTMEHLYKMLFTDENVNLKPSAQWSDDPWYRDQENRDFIENDGYWLIHDGRAEGTIFGGNLCTFNLLLGTKYRPEFTKDTILFIEDDEVSSAVEFDRNLQALCYQPDFKNVKAVVIGRFQKASKVNRSDIEFMINGKEELHNLPVIANVDFGHTTPIATIPLGGNAKINGTEIIISK